MPQSVPAPQVSVQEVSHRLQSRAAGQDDFLILDVREAFELQISQLPEVTHVPLDEIFADEGRRVAELADGRDVLVLCRSGGRSDQAARILQARGVAASNIVGGILAWSMHIDDSVPVY
ncbi:MAG TPA: rhodanese-like domain-containing protein [Actinomycetales bacterium]|nr:rhodanese-like domain-containing protein [Actinomycetales bacterium]